MKIKHKKMVLMISLSALGIGLIAFSVAGKKDKKTEEVASLSASQLAVTQSATPTPTTDSSVTPTPIDVETVTPVAEDETTPTATPTVTELEETKDSEITELVKDFIQAKLNGKSKTLKKLVTDGSYIDTDMIQKKTEFIEAYDNIKVYTKEGTGDIDYIAYVYMEVKIASIDTKAPGLDEYYIKKVDGEYKIVQGEISDETAAYIKDARASEEVEALRTKVNNKLQKAMKSDEALADFCNKLEPEQDSKE